MAAEMTIQEYVRSHSEKDSFETAMFIYESALMQMVNRIDVLNSELNHVYLYNPIEYVKSRLKTPESIMKKLRTCEGYCGHTHYLFLFLGDLFRGGYDCQTG